MTTYNTGNPLGSSAVKDLYDNAQNLDTALNTSALTWIDRGPSGVARTRRSWAGFETQVDDFLLTFGNQYIGEYAADLTFTARNQYTVRQGVAYRPATGSALPLTLTGTWATDQPNLFAFNADAVLRSDLAASGGAALIGALSGTGGPTNVQALLDANRKQLISVKDYGAKGDGVTNDNAAFAAAVAAAVATTHSGLFVPAGDYVVTGGWALPEGSLYFSFYGEGRSTRLKFDATQPLFQAGSGITSHLSFRDFVIDNVGTSSVGANACFWFPGGNTETEFRNISLMPNLPANITTPSFYICGEGKINDTVIFTDCVLHVNKVGVSLGAGSSVWWTGGRIIGADPTTENSVGICLTGGMGGVWVTATDLIGLTNGVLVRQASGVASNRELFLVDACIDSCDVGLNIADASSYVCWTGVWASSCSTFNINFSPTSDSAVLNLTGGTIFNAGALDSTQQLANSGLSINRYGRLLCSGISLRNNRNRAISFNSGDRSAPAIIRGCQFFANGSSRSGSCQVYATGKAIIKDNTFEDAGVPNILIDSNSADKVNISDNPGLQGFSLRDGPAIPASNVESKNTTGQDLTAYFRNGAVNSYWVNGVPVYEVNPGAAANVMLRIPAGGTFKIIYSAAPSVNWYFD